MEYAIDARIKYYQKLAKVTLNATFSIKIATNKQRAFLLNRAAYYMKQAGWLGDLWEKVKKIFKEGIVWVRAVVNHLGTWALTVVVAALLGLLPISGLLPFALSLGLMVGAPLFGWAAAHFNTESKTEFLNRFEYDLTQEEIEELSLSDWVKIFRKPEAIETFVEIHGDKFAALIRKKLATKEGQEWLKEYIEKMSKTEQDKLRSLVVKNAEIDSETFEKILTGVASKDKETAELVELVAQRAG